MSFSFQPTSLPYMPTPSNNSDHMAPRPSSASTTTTAVNKDPLANVKPVQYDNPWDFVPDQPVVTNTNPKTVSNAAIINSCDSSSGISSSSGNDSSSSSSSSGNNNGNHLFPASADAWGNVAKEDDNNGKAVIDNFWNEVDDNAAAAASSNPVHARSKSGGILDDPFDAEWAALATRNNSKNNFSAVTAAAAEVGVGSVTSGSGRSSTNPFHDLTSPAGAAPAPLANGVQAAFELKM